MRILAIARGAGGGDLHPVVAVALELRRRGHDVRTLCDAEAGNLPDELAPFVDADLFSGAVDGGRAAVGSATPDETGTFYVTYFTAVNTYLRDGLRSHVREVDADYVLAPRLVAPAVAEAVDGLLPWCVVNSTFSLAGGDLYAADDYLRPFFARAALVLHATDEIFDRSLPLPPREYRIGPLFWEPAAPLPAYVEEDGPPWALIAISSVPQGDVALVEPALAALGARPVRVLATIGRNDAAACGPVPANARLERFVSHLRVLDRSVLLVSHAGHGSVMKGLWSGVPMVLVPWERDQPGVAARATALGVARVVERDELERLDEAIDDVLRDPVYAEAAARHGRRLRAQDPVARACDLIEAGL